MNRTIKPDPKIAPIYRASFNAKIAKTISLAHLGESAVRVMRESLPPQFHSDLPIAVKGYLQKSETGDRLPCDPQVKDILPYWRDRAEKQGNDLSSVTTIDELSSQLGVAKIKLLSTPGCMDNVREVHFDAWIDAIYKELFPAKARAKKLCQFLYAKKHDFLDKQEPICYHRLPSGDVRPYYEVRGWEFHGDICELPPNQTAKSIDDFNHLDLSPIAAAFNRDPWDDVMETIKWGRSSTLGEAFFTAAHDDFHAWLRAKNSSPKTA